MLFNSPEFLLFLPIVFGPYLFVMQRNLKAQNRLLVIASFGLRLDPMNQRERHYQSDSSLFEKL